MMVFEVPRLVRRDRIPALSGSMCVCVDMISCAGPIFEFEEERPAPTRLMLFLLLAIQLLLEDWVLGE